MAGIIIQGSFPHGLSRIAAGPAHGRGATALPLPPQFGRVVACGGEPIPADVRQRMESAFGARFGDVRLHVTPQPMTIGADAFTSGSHIFFAPRRFDVASPAGQKLLAHELTHVVQQRTGRARSPFPNGIAVLHDAMLEAEAERMAQRATAITPRLPPARPNVRQGYGTIQPLLVTVGDPANSGVDFPALATNLIARLTGDTPRLLSNVAPTPVGFFASLFGRPRETLYICAHGTATGITGYGTAAPLAAALQGRGLNDTTLSRIILVSCIAGGTNPGSASEVFARALATAMNVDVYAPHDIINVHYDTVTTGGMTRYVPTGFSIRDTAVGVIDGAGLVRFQPGGEGYAPPLPASTLARI